MTETSRPADEELRFACPETHAAGVMPVVMQKFAKCYPRVLFRVTTANTTSPAGFGPLREQAVDFILGQTPRNFAQDDLETEILFDEAVCIVVGRHSRWAAVQQVDLVDLIDEHWLLPPPNSPISNLMTEAFQSRGLKLPLRCTRVYSLNLRGRILTGGEFVTVCTSGALGFYRAMAPIKILPISLPEQARPVSIITLKGRKPNPCLDHFLEILRVEAKRMLDREANISDTT